MNERGKDAFLDAKNALLLIRQLARIDRERQSNQSLDEILADEEKRSGYSAKVPLLNQAAFLAMAYSTLVWLRESYFKDDSAKETLTPYVKWIFDDTSLTISTGSRANKITKDDPMQLVRRVRNSLGHASVEIEDDAFVFTDTDPRRADDWVTIRMSWATLGKLCESVINAGNHLLYPGQSDTA